MTQKYGITEWHVFAGKSQMVITGIRANGSAARGVQLAWFKSVPGTVGHTKLMMLDGSGATVRRWVNGQSTGKFSADQVKFLDTMRYDLHRSKATASATTQSGGLNGASWSGGGLHVLGGGTGSWGSDPGTGPACIEAWQDTSILVDGVGCAQGAATFETVIGGVVAILSCTQWYLESEKAKGTCDKENAESCNTDSPPTCDFGQKQDPSTTQDESTKQQCDAACLCANYPKDAQGCGTVGPCTYDTDCGSGESCQSKICAATPASNDSPTDNTIPNGNSSSPSCANGEVSADSGSGQVGCSQEDAKSSGDSKDNTTGEPSTSTGNEPKDPSDPANNGQGGSAGEDNGVGGSAGDDNGEGGAAGDDNGEGGSAGDDNGQGGSAGDDNGEGGYAGDDNGEGGYAGDDNGQGGYGDEGGYDDGSYFRSRKHPRMKGRSVKGGALRK